MTDHDGIKAEIFRRSETRIRAIRRRRAVVLSVVPAVFCAAALIFVSVSGNMFDVQYGAKDAE